MNALPRELSTQVKLLNIIWCLGGRSVGRVEKASRRF
jgi:hypothetical protein